MHPSWRNSNLTLRTAINELLSWKLISKRWTPCSPRECGWCERSCHNCRWIRKSHTLNVGSNLHHPYRDSTPPATRAYTSKLVTIYWQGITHSSSWHLQWRQRNSNHNQKHSTTIKWISIRGWVFYRTRWRYVTSFPARERWVMHKLIHKYFDIYYTMTLIRINNYKSHNSRYDSMMWYMY